MKRNTRILIVTGTVAGLMLLAGAAFAAPAQPATAADGGAGYVAQDGQGQVTARGLAGAQERARLRAGLRTGQGQGRGPGLGMGARAGHGHGRVNGFRRGAGFGPAEGRGLKRGARDGAGKGQPYHCDQSCSRCAG